MTEFTKEELVYWSQTQPLAAFALAQMERAENAEAERDRLKKELEEASGAIVWLAAVKMFNAVPPDQVSAAISRARERGAK